MKKTDKITIKGVDYYSCFEVTSRRIKAFEDGYNKALEDVIKYIDISFTQKEAIERVKKLKKQESRK